MRKIIVGLIIIAIGVLCLSFTSRISEGIFDTFFDDVSSVNSGNNNTNNSTGGNASGNNSNTGDNVSAGGSSGGNGSTSGDSSDTGNNDSTGGGVEDGGSSSGGDSSGNEGSSTVTLVYYQRSDNSFGKNYIVDTANGEKNGNYYYYLVQGGRGYVKSDVPLDDTKRYIVDINSPVYLRTSLAVSIETTDKTDLIPLGMFNSIETSSTVFGSYIGYASEEISVDMSRSFQIGNYCFAATLYGDYYVFVKSDNSFAPMTWGYTVYNNSPLFGLTYIYTEETDVLSDIEQGGFRV